MPAEKRKIAFHTLGCKLNFAESSYIASLLPSGRYEKVSPDRKADIYVINTCTVTAEADKKCRQAIRKFINLSPGAIIAVIGCYSQLRASEIASIPGVDIVLGSGDKYDLPLYLENIPHKKKSGIITGTFVGNEIFIPSWSAGDRTRTFVKIQDGCDYGCSYCTIPMARGRSRSADIKTIIEELKRISEKRIPEVVLTGVNIGDFGRSAGESFAGLLREAEKIDGIGRIRLSSVEPNLLSNEIIEMVSLSKKIMPHFHIPLQSGSNRILGLMRRRYRREVFAWRVEKIKSLMPLAGIGADVITGFPGESESDFEETFSFLESLPVTYLHVFPYSERPGTPAASLPGKVPAEVRNARRKKLTALSGKKNLGFKQQNINSNCEVLFESSVRNRIITGFTGNYLKAEHPYETGLKGKIIKVKINGIAPSGNLSVTFI